MTSGIPRREDPGVDTTALRLAVDGPVGRITLARPDKLNALNRAALEELGAAARWFDAQPDVGVVVVAGEGRAFSAGFDLTDRSWTDGDSSAVLGRAMAEAIGGMAAVTVAAIHGHCIGGAVVLASACDLRVAAAGTSFRIPEVDLGMPLYWTGVPRLVRELGPALTKELVLTGRTFDAAEALAMRFVNRVVPDDELTRAVDALAAELGAKAPLLLRVTKQQVEEAARPVPSTDGGIDADIAGYREAARDPAARAAGAAYLRRRT
jgi:enoyl-CoA hydratase/carnithine racemase